MLSFKWKAPCREESLLTLLGIGAFRRWVRGAVSRSLASLSLTGTSKWEQVPRSQEYLVGVPGGSWGQRVGTAARRYEMF